MRASMDQTIAEECCLYAPHLHTFASSIVAHTMSCNYPHLCTLTHIHMHRHTPVRVLLVRFSVVNFNDSTPNISGNRHKHTHSWQSVFSALSEFSRWARIISECRKCLRVCVWVCIIVRPKAREPCGICRF